MLVALIAAVVLSAFLNAAGLTIAKPIYEAMSSLGVFDTDIFFAMSEYCEDMTEKAKNGEYHDFFMRDDKIENLTDILSLGAKSNPCIVAGRGVGKKALVEGLAYRIAHGNAPEKMKNKKIFKLNIYKLIVGNCNPKSSALGRLKSILSRAKSDKNIILFIDDICQVYKIPGAPELIKTYLDSSDIKIIASATDEEYSSMLKNDGFAQDYTYIFMEEPSKFDTFRILKYLKNDIEKKQNLKIFDEVLMDIVNLTGRYMKNKRYPNKAVDILNLALVNAQKRSNGGGFELEHRDVITALSEATNVPIGDLSEDEAEALETMGERIKKVVVGQENAVDLVCSAVKRGRLGFCDENKARASFLFIGPSGVGKSELARVLGEEIGSFISIDMIGSHSKFFQKKLIGSAETKGELIEKIIKNPYSVVMFDNIDSASDETLGIIYEILDRGYLTDFSGKKVDFTNAIIIMTADTGVNFSGFEKKEDILEDFLNKNFVNKLGKSLIKKLTNIIVFNSLSKENYNLIVKTKVSELESRLQNLEINIKISDDVISHICKLCCEDKNLHGARTVSRIISESLEIPISDLMMKRQLRGGGQVDCALDAGKIKIKVINNL